ncbi:receptor-type tyrosine-protein phosphatase N2 isoform X1 [Eurytemora carolleeae]|uniref:receptor-type tyrosine-protein phosphatase N2 isoform X1 n=2 Tax=Eurytemora carolleeae TaxID=1294199 RepID=UPI000C7717B9|nr:receptor-type tyrosine-protein phosphatase N2 isoform X1 [Eurytemora carolleeae]|eukprot:XP_023329697.1 receptor-type tyrosine-protein phosphatase N2-like isoform X1 [Eurytemora affinis]
MIPDRDAHRSSLLLQGCIFTLQVLAAASAQNVGCLFSGQVCEEGEECFNDLVIGRCVSDSRTDPDVFRMGPLSGPPMDLLEAEMRRVFSQGFTWEDNYSQCIFQTLLEHVNNRELYSPDECSHLLAETLEAEENGGEEAEENFQLSPDTDDFENLKLDFGPGLEQSRDFSDDALSGYTGETEQDFNKILIIPTSDDFSEDSRFQLQPYLPENIPEDILSPEDTIFNEDEILTDIMPEVIPVYLEDQTPDRVPDIVADEDDLTEALENLENLQSMFYAPTNVRRKRPSNNDWVILKDLEEKNDENVSTMDFDYNDSAASQDGDNDDTVYYGLDEPAAFETIFDRRERLDVKKPGPFFANSQNNFFLDKLLRLEENTGSEEYQENDVGQTEYENSLPTRSKEKKAVKINGRTGVLQIENPTPQDSYLVVNIKDRFKTLGQAVEVVDAIATQLHVPRNAFGEPRLSTSQLSIPVESNPRQLNASEMADILGHQLDLVNKRTDRAAGITIESFSSGDENNVVSVYTGHSQLFLALFILTAAVASVLVSGCLVLILRRRRNKKSENKDDREDREEPVKEYKQLVRDWSRSSRASQSSSGGGGPGNGVGAEDGSRVRTISEDGAKKQPLIGATVKQQNSSDSGPSSTSSCRPEEPGVSSMDISTGHMVLAYMEDHLNNKQRLEQEWVGLCAYEAEPAATSVAFKVENKKKNRYPDKLPYDHNRVLLNALVNGNNSDYINASTVTDHDPRNPAYIVTQGPMSHTIADFWQMVWEQGSVVIVMLSRLAENGYQLAHRYWPEEGSQQYHIYEVHLVSEHVWCDDYLVRSLYLKNTQTGETRTVTQFHFLSWSDGATPVSTKSLLEFRRKVNKSYRGRSCPIIVHCSDGVGRSGTYILLDMVLNRMCKGSKEIDIAATLEHIRDQRSGMVQTRSQFEFCLTAVAEETHAILKSLAQ